MRSHNGGFIAGGLLACLLLLWGGQMSCSQIRNLPETLEYRFGVEASLTKQHDYMAITVTPKSTDAQRGTPALPMRAVVIDSADFKTLWAELQKIDLTALTEPAADDFEPLPPDVSHVERLHLAVNGDTVVDWSHPMGRLKSAPRKRLDRFEDVLIKVFKKRLEKPVMPSRFRLEMVTAEQGRLTLVKDGDEVTLQSGEEATPVTKFAAFFGELQRAGTIYRAYGLPGPPRGPAPPEPAYALTVTINDVIVRSVGLAETAADQDAFASLRTELEKLGQ